MFISLGVSSLRYFSLSSLDSVDSTPFVVCVLVKLFWSRVCRDMFVTSHWGTYYGSHLGDLGGQDSLLAFAFYIMHSVHHAGIENLIRAKYLIFIYYIA